MGTFGFDGPLIYLLIAWSIVWKSVALWYAARNKQLGWYIALIIINTAGILEIIYLAFFKRDKEKEIT